MFLSKSLYKRASYFYRPQYNFGVIYEFKDLNAIKGFMDGTKPRFACIFFKAKWNPQYSGLFFLK